MKATKENLVKCLNNLINLYNRNMGYEYEVRHYDEDGQIGVFCNPTNAIINDVMMVARAFLKDGSSVVNVNFSFGFIEIYYCDTKFKKNADTELLEMVGAMDKKGE